MLKNKRKGLTLIEVILAMLILSVILVTYITMFGQSAIHVSKGKDITKDTFSYQDIMENAMVEGKRSFIESKLPGDYSIEVFKDHTKYKTTIETKEIKTTINGNRQYIAYVTNFEIQEPKSPKINPFDVGVYIGDKKAFPWYQDNIQIVSKYTLKDDPIIFENRIRWYESNKDILNPVFSSDYYMIYEEIQKEPHPKGYINKLIKNKIKPERFYYFEARPYTLTGRIEHFRNEDRILILNRVGSLEWQNFMEYIYFNKAKKFAHSNKEIYLDIMQNSDHPTLNLDWSENSNPEGALVGMRVPNICADKSFVTSINLQFDSIALNNSTNLGIGMALVDEENTGVIIDLKALTDKISISYIENGKYENGSPLKKFNIQDEEFKAFREKNGELFDWSKEYSLIIQYHEEKLIIRLENEGIISKPLEIDFKDKNFEPKYIGLKSYSNIDYMPDLKYEIYNKYDRNYSSHFYNIDFKELDKDWVIDGEDDNYFYNGESSTLTGNNHPDLKTKLTRKDTKLAGNRSELIAESLWFAPEIETLNLQNHVLSIKAKEVIFDVPIVFHNNADGIKISGIDNTTYSAYPVKVYFREGQKIKINDGSEMTLDKGKYLSIKSGSINLNDNSSTINIVGSDVDVMSGN